MEYLDFILIGLVATLGILLVVVGLERTRRSARRRVGDGGFVLERRPPIEAPKTPKKAAADLWSHAPPTQTYRTEAAELDGMTFTVTRRTLSFIEEQNILARVRDPRTGLPDTMELLALTFEATVKDNDFGLTPERIRNDLAERPALAWFLLKWLCAETLQNIRSDAVEVIRKKPGP